MAQAETWITARELTALRGGSLRRARELLVRLEAHGARVRAVRSRRGRPTKLLCLEDYERFLAGLPFSTAANDDGARA